MKKKPMLDKHRIEKMIEQQGLTPGTLAYRAGVSYDTIYKLRETDRPRTSAEVVARLAAAFGCSIEYLMGMTDNPAPPAGVSRERIAFTVEDSGRRERLKEIGEYFVKLNEDEAELILQMVRRVAWTNPTIEDWKKRKDVATWSSLWNLVATHGGAALVAEFERALGMDAPPDIRRRLGLDPPEE